MGTICILLGVLILIGFIGGGFLLAHLVIIPYTNQMTISFTTLSSMSNETIYILCMGILGFIGFMCFMNLLMHGLTYNKLCKINRRLGKRH